MKVFKSFILSFVALWAFALTCGAQPYPNSGLRRLTEVNDSIEGVIYYTRLDPGPDVVYLGIMSRMYRHAFVGVSINRRLYYRFVFDTGSSRMILNSRRVPMEPGDTLTPIGRVSSGSQMRQYDGVAEVDSIRIGQWKSGPRLMIIDDCGPVTNYSGIDGLIGMTEIEDYDILFDWHCRYIMLIKPHLTDSILQGRYEVTDQVPIFTLDSLACCVVEPQVKGRWATHQYRLLIDTGSPVSLVPEEAKRWVFNLFPAKLASLGSEPKKVKHSHLRFQLGNKKFRRITTVLVPDSYFTETYKKYNIQGIIGINVLKRQPFVLSRARSQLLLLKQAKR